MNARRSPLAQRQPGTRTTLVACAVSVVLCSLLSFIPWEAGAFLGKPISFAPGLVFGCCFGWVNIAGRLRNALFTVASGLLYIGAVHAYLALMGSPFGPDQAAPKLLPGLIGGLGLAVSSKLATGVPLRLRDEALAAIVGAVLGIVFITLVTIPPPPIGYVLAFASWQIPVGWQLSVNLQRGPAASTVAPAA